MWLLENLEFTHVAFRTAMLSTIASTWIHSCGLTWIRVTPEIFQYSDKKSKFESQLCHLVAGWPWAGDLGQGLAHRKVKVLVAQSSPTVCDSMVCRPPGSSLHGILQARILEWAAMPFSRGSSQPRHGTQISCIVGAWKELEKSHSHREAVMCSSHSQELWIQTMDRHPSPLLTRCVTLKLFHPPHCCTASVWV